RRPEPPTKPVHHREPVLREIRDGLRIVARSPVLRALALAHGGTHILWGVFGTSYLLYANKELGLDPASIGIIAALGGVGSLLGAVMSIAVVWLSPVRHIRDTTMSAGPALPGDQAPLTE